MDGAGGGTNDDQNRLAEVERQLAELRAEVQRLGRDVGRLSGGTSELPDGGSRWGAAAQPEVVLTVFVSVKRQIPPLVRGVPGGRVTVVPLKSTVVVHAPAELCRRWEPGMLMPAPLRQQANSLLDGVRERLAGQLAGFAMDPMWDLATADWYVTDIGGFDAAARLFGDLDTWSHSAVASWVTQVSVAIGMPGAMADGAGVVIGFAVPLPIDRPLKALSRITQVAGVAFAVLTGNPVLACASLKALAHDQLIDLVVKGIRDVASLKPVIPTGTQQPIRSGPAAQPIGSGPARPSGPVSPEEAEQVRRVEERMARGTVPPSEPVPPKEPKPWNPGFGP